MQKYLFHRFLGLFAIVTLLVSCRQVENPGASPVKWFSLDPFAIPFRLRIQKFERGNLLQDSGSFESGKVYNLDSSRTSFNIDGWLKIGEDVHWVNKKQDSIYNPDEVHSGNYAVKIQRVTANETVNKGEGIQSDYIKVIPGRYELTLFLRLKNIRGYRTRLGSKLYDAVDIRIFYFDKNKIPMSNEQYVPQTKEYIDRSFKSYSLSNFWYISDFGWAKIIGKSINNPYLEGNIPDEARYVKLYIGLKGTGTMWVDDVDFRYTRDNFSTRERLENLIDTVYAKHDLLLPSPKKYKKVASVLYLKKDGNISANQLPFILVPTNITSETRQAVEVLKNNLTGIYRQLTGKKIQYPDNLTGSYISVAELANERLVFSVGKTQLYYQYQKQLPADEIKNIPQSYFIFSPSEETNIVFLSGDKPVGDYYAALTAVQLLDHRQFIFHNARIIDYPDFEKRYYTLGDLSEIKTLKKNFSFYKMLNNYKFNGGYLFDNVQKVWTSSMETEIPKLKRTIFQEGVSRLFIAFVNGNFPAYNYYLADTLQMNYIKPLSKVSKDELVKRSKAAFVNGIDGIAYMTSTGIFPSIQFPWNNKFFPDDPASQVNLINDLKKLVLTEYSNKDFEFLPSWSNNEIIDRGLGRGELYFQRLAEVFPAGIDLLWMGNTYCTYNLSKADLFRLQSCVDLQPVLWDNSLWAKSILNNCNYFDPEFAGQIRLGNLFAPYQCNFTNDIKEGLTGKKIIVNYSANSEIEMIRLITAADYTWNSGEYDPDISVCKVLVSLYGPKVAKALVFFNDSYTSLLASILEMKNSGSNQRIIRKGEMLLADMDKQINVVRQHLMKGQHIDLELKSLRNNMEKMLTRLQTGKVNPN
jgi:hypothetical protein